MRILSILLICALTAPFAYAAPTGENLTDKLKAFNEAKVALQTSSDKLAAQLVETDTVLQASEASAVSFGELVPLGAVDGQMLQLSGPGEQLEAGEKSPLQEKKGVVAGGKDNGKHGSGHEKNEKKEKSEKKKPEHKDDKYANTYGKVDSYETYCDPYDPYCESTEPVTYCGPYDPYCTVHSISYY
jgi:hypothetical protein